jgi:hypothetical protein
MPTLSKELRRTLENVVADARRIAEAGAEQALKQLAVHHSESWPAMTNEEKALREKLRAHGKQLGDKREVNRTQEIPRLKQACAYEHWHRMLFARFLAENNLLIHPDYGEPTSLEEVKELAREQNSDWLSIAASFAQRMLLEVFHPDDPVLDLVLPPETRQKLDEKLSALPTEVFTAEDSLGWVYQFWQRDEKDAVNKSEVKIGADELAPLTQLFTEDYMVLFLLHNTLGAWWISKRCREGKSVEIPKYEWTYLRMNEDGAPAAGGFDQWPKAARHLRVLDPCMGSGHFLIFALPILARMRAEEEGLSLADATIAALRENLFGLELDLRCSQIAAFNLALTAWRLIGAHCALPPLNLACSGLGINASEADWVKLAGEDGKAREEMKRLYSLFRDAPTLGSLVDPGRLQANVYASGSESVFPLLEEALRNEQASDETRELAIAAQGVVAAFRVLAGQFTLVATNVPYLGRGKQDSVLATYCEEFHSDAKADLATCVLDRCLRFCSKAGTAALVTTQNWLYLTSYRMFRERIIADSRWHLLARLGPRAFETIGGEVVTVVLLAVSNELCSIEHEFCAVDVGEEQTPADKARKLRTNPMLSVNQAVQKRNADARIVLSTAHKLELLQKYAHASHGQGTFDSPRFSACFWELPKVSDGWVLQQSTPARTQFFGGCSFILRWEEGHGALAGLMRSKEAEGYSSGKWKAGVAEWGKAGLLIGQMGDLPCTLYMGQAFDENASVVIPENGSDLPGMWAFAASPVFRRALKDIDQSIKVTCKTLVKVAFDRAHWNEIASTEFPNGLPTPTSIEPNQWLFDGNPYLSTVPLQVGIARLLGYRWPRQTGSTCLDCPVLESDGLDTHADADGIVCMSSLLGEAPAADRLRALLASAFGSEWSAAKLAELLGDSESLECWLRDQFFAEHCHLFDHRPFIWHVWDGRKDGFHALVNYHRLVAPGGEGRKTLEKLIYTVLGDWITRQNAEVASGVDGADARLSAALHLQRELEKILLGERPYDLFVRWKPIHEQPIGWEPDLNDGVRLNLRPWLTAQPYRPARKGSSILRITPNVKYGKDRGKDPLRDKDDFPWCADSGERNNEIHLSLDEKRAARERWKK